MLDRKRRALSGLVLLFALAACESGDPLAAVIGERAPAPLVRLECTVAVARGAMACAQHTPGTGGSMGLIVGGQNRYVFLQASSHAWSAADSVYSMDVTVQNLLPQAMGTLDGTTLDSAGVRVFFDAEPFALTGDAAATLALLSPVRRTTILRAGQAFYQYGQVLQAGQTSSPVTWRVKMPPAVTSFRFSVYVQGEVAFPDGWIAVTPAVDSLVQGRTVTLAATVNSAVGEPVAGQPVTWGTSNPAVATVDSAGTVTGVAPGTAFITATSGVRSGSATLSVCPDLAVGEVYTAAMPAASSVCFAGDSTGTAEYTYMPVNLSGASALSLAVTGSGVIPVTGLPTPLLVSGGRPLVDGSAERLGRGGDVHMQMLERDRREVSRLLARPGARVHAPGGGRREHGGPRFLLQPGTPALGDLWSLNTASGCEGTPDLRSGRVVSVGRHVIVVADTMNPAGGFTTAQYDSIALEFDSLAWPVAMANFGVPGDLDQNQRMVAFYTRAVNELTPPGSTSFVGGYFASRDLLSADAAVCPRSNQGEMFYMSVPDPAGAVNGNVRQLSAARTNTVGTMAHELQHLVNASRRIYVHGAPLETVWLNEGLSHIAEELVFYRAAGLAPRGNIEVATLTLGSTSERRLAAFSRYSNQNFGRLRVWLLRPDASGAMKANDVLATRGAVWGFLRYAADRANGDDAALWFSLVNTTRTGTTNLQAALGGVDANVWLRDFTSAIYADDAVAGIGAPQQVTSWNFRSVYGQFPALTQPLNDGESLSLSYSAGGGTAFVRFAVPPGGFAGVTALSGGAVPASPYSLIVVRTR